jgi:hypothetical protein
MATQRLHPCPTCHHETMDACWAAEKTLGSRGKRLCLDCHDECIAKGQGKSTLPPPRSTKQGGSLDIRRLMMARDG